MGTEIYCVHLNEKKKNSNNYCEENYEEKRQKTKRLAQKAPVKETCWYVYGKIFCIITSKQCVNCSYEHTTITKTKREQEVTMPKANRVYSL